MDCKEEKQSNRMFIHAAQKMEEKKEGNKLEKE